MQPYFQAILGRFIAFAKYGALYRIFFGPIQLLAFRRTKLSHDATTLFAFGFAALRNTSFADKAKLDFDRQENAIGFLLDSILGERILQVEGDAFSTLAVLKNMCLNPGGCLRNVTVVNHRKPNAIKMLRYTHEQQNKTSQGKALYKH